MNQIIKQTLAFLLVLVQLFVLCPIGMTQAQAAAAQTSTNVVPALNKTIVGTVKFQSFNFLGDNVNGVDGTDYKSTFYYSDDYFSPSAINSAADKRTMLWSDLDNKALASCSIDFAVAAMTSAKGDVLDPTNETWDNSSYDPAIKEKNVRDYLGACGFAAIKCTDLDKRPTNDSIGYTLASKEITVWNADTERNETYTLIAVGVRGAGYGQEWASNVTIGNPDTGLIPDNGRHYGFDSSAVKVCDGIETYLRENSITGNVKYWVTGFSRAAAVANLAAGYLTDDADQYLTQQKDVYAYTWECPQAAKKTVSPDTNFSNYKNIHNILNPMDAVPKVSPDEFEHQRLGVDYQMPYHDNVTSPAQNTTLYNQMYEVLKTIATGCEYTGKVDPLIEAVSPSNYPYNKPITIYRVNGPTLIEQALAYAVSSDKENAKLLKEFGTEVAEQKHKEHWYSITDTGNADHLLGWEKGMDYKTTTWYLDDFIDGLVDVFLTSKAWIGEIGPGRTELENRATFISRYQPYFRTLFGYFLDYAGPAFLDLVPSLVNAVTSNIGSTIASPFPAAFLAFYASPTTNAFRWAASNAAKPIMHDVIDSLTDGFPDPEYQGITKAQAKNAMDQLVPLVFDLYAYELEYYNSQYLGTTLRYLNTILCTHEQETVMSWIMSLDPNHMNRSCRTLTVPASADVTLYEFREQYGEQPTDGETTAQPVALIHGGDFVDGTRKDERITLSQSDGKLVIRYPASLEIRADVTATSDFDLSAVSVKDYQTKTAYEKVSDGAAQFSDGLPAASYSAISSSKTNASSVNTSLNTYGVLEEGDTLHVLVNDSSNENTKYVLSVDKKPTNIVADYAAKTVVAQSYSGQLPADSRFTLENGTLYWNGFAGSLTAGSTVETAADLTGVSSASSLTTETKAPAVSITTRKAYFVVPASSVYFDDSFAKATISGTPGDSAFSLDTERLDTDTQTNGFWFQFRGSRIDVYCTTDSDAGYVSAGLFDANLERVRRPDGKVLVATVKSASDLPLYNVPTVSFDGLDASAVHYFKLSALQNSNYKLDGIRVYNPTNDAARFLNVRSLLLDAEAAETADGVSGVAYSALNGDAEALETYTKDGPKSEVYLERGESISFHVDGNCDVAVGLSAPEDQGNGVLTVTNGSGTKMQTVSSVVDTYYSITPSDSNDVMITNDSDVMAAVTNIRLTPKAGAVLASAPIQVNEGLRSYARMFRSLSAVPIEAEQPAETAVPAETPAPTPTPSPTPDPTPSSIVDLISQLLSNFVQNLFGGIARLFGH